MISDKSLGPHSSLIPAILYTLLHGHRKRKNDTEMLTVVLLRMGWFFFSQFSAFSMTTYHIAHHKRWMTMAFIFRSCSFWKNQLIPFSLFFHCGFYSVHCFNHVCSKHTNKYNTLCTLRPMSEDNDCGITESLDWIPSSCLAISHIRRSVWRKQFPQLTLSEQGQGRPCPCHSSEPHDYTSQFGFCFVKHMQE